MTARVALVTGGSRGIGASIAESLARDGFDIAISYARNATAAEQTVERIAATGRAARAYRAGEGANAAEDLIGQVARDFGRLDVLVCNAGIYPYARVRDMTAQQVDATLGLNVRAVMLETIAAVRHMPRGGRIIFIGSTFGERAPFPGISLYSATKAALTGFARGLARDLGPDGITVNVIQPGPIDTDMNPADGAAADMLRGFLCVPEYGKPGDIAAMASFLARPESDNITGAALTVDGGLAA
ncbi:SDR family NAD(P)-dependent oxidoreductase [Novacetimonas pomaceti]|uniref:SDR family NAD(P)-dependent oxidoreductase n=1 Tax=Novacetimonas pomaceti TaxID=2021998 RepID=UPI001C2D9AF9|nr:SDR family oxidoreductase [Novacetimonas pomaceti]MBV1833806.1 SDR family oxidoreductase [Novacetimonas pomaceti]